MEPSTCYYQIRLSSCRSARGLDVIRRHNLEMEINFLLLSKQRRKWLEKVESHIPKVHSRTIR